METSGRARRVSGRQLDILWEFLIHNKDIASAYNRSLHAKEYSRRKWTEIAATLNAEGDGAHKDWKGWSKYWVDYKAKIKSKVAALRSSQTRTGGGPSTERCLTDIEKRFLQILGEDFGHGISGVRVEPFLEPLESDEATETVDSQDSPASQSILTMTIPSLQIHPLVQDSPVAPDPPSIEILPTLTLSRLPHPDTPPLPPPHPDTPPPPHPDTPLPHPDTPAAAARSPRRRRLRREAPMSQATARRAIVRAVERHTNALEQLVQIGLRVERILGDAFPRAVGRENFA